MASLSQELDQARRVGAQLGKEKLRQRKADTELKEKVSSL